MKKLFSLTLSLLMLIACSLGTVSAFAAEGEEPTPVDLRHRPGEVDRHRRLYRRGEPQL